MKADLLFGKTRVGGALNDLLMRGGHEDFRFAVAYARRAGVVLLQNSMRAFVECGGGVTGIVGVNQGNTSYQGLCLLADIIGDGLHLRCAKKGGVIFHPKLYVLGDLDKRRANVGKPAVIVGSSNMTRGGLLRNEECDLLVEEMRPGDDFSLGVESFWAGLRLTDEHFSTIRATDDILSRMKECGALVDEDQASEGRRKVSRDIESELAAILAESTSSEHRFFAMTLSHFDVSKESADPVILIPISARKRDEKFWFWPDHFVVERKLPGLYLGSQIKIDGRVVQESIRIYDYPAKSEFRLKSETIKRRGKPGDILVVERLEGGMNLFLIRKDDQRYATWTAKLTFPVSSQKRYGYLSSDPSA